MANGAVYFGCDDHNVYALDATFGTLLWSFTTGEEVFSSPAVANGVVYVGSNDGSLYALDASTGRKIWDYPAGKWGGSSPAVAKGVVYIGSVFSSGYNIHAVNAISGKGLWNYAAGYVESSPAVADGILYVGSGDANVYAFGLPHADENKHYISRRPTLKSLSPDFNLKASEPSRADSKPSDAIPKRRVL